MELTEMPLSTAPWCLDENGVCLLDEATLIGTIIRRGPPGPKSAMILLSTKKRRVTIDLTRTMCLSRNWLPHLRVPDLFRDRKGIPVVMSI